VATNFGDFQNEVYAEAVHGVTARYPFDFASIERKASEALPDWVYRYVSAAAGDGPTQRANIAAFSCYGIVPRMMVSPPEWGLCSRRGSMLANLADQEGRPDVSNPVDHRPGGDRDQQCGDRRVQRSRDPQPDR
jgi:hypothetical protein